ncbi:MAG: Asp-tRNA(Asn)/Glu-tRNA(Gln) amidotransferase subunit GatC [Armatimonadetes bacterium]|nr:Asp-tRNA(Asn)/Glu-tRNA(Gln) amidotransferase subunit GatC [Armatimonadota bacterium]
MRITSEYVGQIGRLSRLALTDAEKERLTTHLNAILAHFERLQELDTTQVPPTAHSIPMENVFRDDTPRPGLTPAEATAAAPESAEDMFVGPRIVET